MRHFKTILKFELDNYFKSKSYIISTILICILAIGIMFAPRVIDSFKKEASSSESAEGGNQGGLKEKHALFDQSGVVTEESLKEFFPDAEFVICDTKEQVKKMVSEEEVERGFAVNSLTDYDYYVFNKKMTDDAAMAFSEYMSYLIRVQYCTEHDLAIDDFFAMEYQEIVVNEEIIGKNSVSGFWYCYILVIIIFMLIIMYGVSIAASVTNEKSNRSIEILVTSTSSTAVLFGKVVAGAIATLFQAGVIGVSLLGSYQINKGYWGSMLSMALNIPTNVVITFIIFGLGGFLVYAFLYGALGALVSKIEDLNKTAGTAQMLVSMVYIVVLLNLQNVDGVVIKVFSFLPISSYSAMFARVAMGSVELWEVIVSAIILYATVVLAGILGGKIFRNSTLRYGNPIKLSNAFKLAKKDK